jgi:pSer/pThr/pTyr-binding forkhead associated (FHA) protein
MSVKLVVRRGKATGRTIHLQAEETIIGRRHGCGVRLPSPDVSRRHCLLSFRDGVLRVEDLDSINGTFLNGQRVTGKQLVHPGDRLQVGPVTFLVEYALNEARSDQRPHRSAEKRREESRLIAPPTAEEEPDTVKRDQESGRPDGDLPLEEQVEADDVVEELDEAEHWDLPEPDQLRDILSQMDK